MFKNTASNFVFFAFNTTTNVPATGIGGTIVPYVSKDFGTVTALGTATMTEMDSTHAPGYYLATAAQAETNANELLLSATCSTSNVVCIGAPARITTLPTNGILAPATLGYTLNTDSSGNASIKSALKKDIAVPIFSFLMTDSTTHNPKTGLGSAVTVTRSIDGGAFSAGTIGAVTELSNGIYYCSLGAGDVNGNNIVLQCTASGADTVFPTIFTEPT